MNKNQDFNNVVDLFLERFSDDQETSSKNKSLDTIWDLGNLIKREIDKGMSLEEIISFVEPQISTKTDLKKNTIFRNLRVSYKVVKYFPRKQEWLQITPRIGNFKKLKLLESLLDADYRKEKGIPDIEFNDLMDCIKDLTGEQLGQITKKLIGKYVKTYSDIDIEIIWLNCYSINIILKEVIDKNDSKFIKNFRDIYKLTKINDVRLFLSMIKNEKVFEKHKSRFKSFNFIGEVHNTQLADFNENLSQLLQELMKTEKSNMEQREKMRSKIPISWLGQISTRLNALSEDKELERYRLNESILNKFLEGKSQTV